MNTPATQETTKLTYNEDYNAGYNAGFYTQPQIKQNKMHAVYAVMLAIFMILVLSKLGNAQPAPAYNIPEHGQYQDSFNGSFNDNSWKWDFCAGYCPR